MIEVKNLDFSYQGSEQSLFGNLSFNIPEGHIYGFLGNNGVGKSTLLYLLTGLIRPKSGEILLDEQKIKQRKQKSLSKFVILPEEINLPEVSANTFLKINSSFYENFSKEDFYNYLELLDVSRNMNIGNMSMGQRKKFYISFLLACHTKYVIMDEPTNGLDINSKSNFRKVIALTSSQNQTIIISTHQVHDIHNLIDNVLILHNKKILLYNSISEISKRLKFIETFDPEIINSALYHESLLSGINTILPRKEEEEETDVDIELLYKGLTGNNNNPLINKIKTI